MRRTARTSSPRATLPRLLLLLAAGACAAAPVRSAPTSDDGTAAREIAAMLDASAEAWNRGDLDAFVSDYAADATFVGSRGLIRGASEIRRRYAEGYWSGGAPPARLRFEILDVRVTGPGTAVTVGRYVLSDRESGATAGTGVFTLALVRMDGSWKIVHDHSSADAQD